jgi:hypothetical protein
MTRFTVLSLLPCKELVLLLLIGAFSRHAFYRLGSVASPIGGRGGHVMTRLAALSWILLLLLLSYRLNPELHSFDIGSVEGVRWYA